MDWCSVYLTPQGLSKYIYLSPLLMFPTTYNGIRTKNRPVWITPGAAPIRWMGPTRNPRWEQKRTEGYVNVSRACCDFFYPSTTLKNHKGGMSNFHTTLFLRLRLVYWKINKITLMSSIQWKDIKSNNIHIKLDIRTTRYLDIPVLCICDISVLDISVLAYSVLPRK
jgi:hypothetical protein